MAAQRLRGPTICLMSTTSYEYITPVYSQGPTVLPKVGKWEELPDITNRRVVLEKILLFGID